MLAFQHLALFPILCARVFAAPTERQHGLQIVSDCTEKGMVALTFDGTFFLNGKNWGCIYDHVQLIRDLYAQNHTLASHTWSHPNLAHLSAEIHNELAQLETAFIRILGVKPLYFRPPYGSYNDRVLNVLAQRGYTKLFMWTDDCQDAMGANLDKQNGVMDGVSRSFASPKLLLQHSVVESSVDATRYGLAHLRDAGYKLVTVEQCLGSSGEWPYVRVGEPGIPDSSWTC